MVIRTGLRIFGRNVMCLILLPQSSGSIASEIVPSRVKSA